MCYLSFVGTSMVERNVFPQFVLVGEASGDFAEGANKHFALFSLDHIHVSQVVHAFTNLDSC